MPISLQKGANVNLSKSAPGLTKALLGLGWDARSTDGAAFDLDASALLLAADGKVRSDADFVFYGNKATADGSVSHGGDNLTGAGDGDDEQITIDLSTVPADIERVALVVSIYEAAERSQTFGQVRNAFIRLANAETGAEEVRYDLSEDYSTETAVIFAEVYRNNGEWKFKAIGQGFGDGLGGVARDFGVSV